MIGRFLATRLLNHFVNIRLRLLLHWNFFPWRDSNSFLDRAQPRALWSSAVFFDGEARFGLLFISALLHGKVALNFIIVWYIVIFHLTVVNSLLVELTQRHSFLSLAFLRTLLTFHAIIGTSGSEPVLTFISALFAPINSVDRFCIFVFYLDEACCILNRHVLLDHVYKQLAFFVRNLRIITSHNIFFETFNNFYSNKLLSTYHFC